MADPVIVTQPSNSTVPVGYTAAFSVVAGGGSGNYTYQWQALDTRTTPGTWRNSSGTGTTTSTMTTLPTNVAQFNGLQLRVVVTDTSNGASITSNTVTLTVTSPPTFTWIPDAGASIKREPRLLSVSFGDGYEQRAADGINNDLRVATVAFTGRSSSEAAAIITFLGGRAGSGTFYYTHAGDTQRKWVCKTWTETTTSNGIVTVSAEFREVMV